MRTLAQGFSWADEDEDEVMETLQTEMDRKKAEEAEKRKVHVQVIVNYLDESDNDYPQIGLILFMLMSQKTINIYREGKELREYRSSKIMYDIQKYLLNNINQYKWTELIHDVCRLYCDKVQGNLLTRALDATIDKEKILPMTRLEQAVLHNRKLCKERLGAYPITTP